MIIDRKIILEELQYWNKSLPYEKDFFALESSSYWFRTETLVELFKFILRIQFTMQELSKLITNNKNVLLRYILMAKYYILKNVIYL